MSYYNCRNGTLMSHDDCNGYVGPLDTYRCTCECHGTAGCVYGTCEYKAERDSSYCAKHGVARGRGAAS